MRAATVARVVSRARIRSPRTRVRTTRRIQMATTTAACWRECSRTRREQCGARVSGGARADGDDGGQAFGVWGSGVMGDNCVFVRVAVGEGRSARACKRERTHGVMDSRDAYGRVV